MDFSLSCRLDYTVEQPSTFLFHLGVESNRLQVVQQESLLLDPTALVEELCTPRAS